MSVRIIIDSTADTDESTAKRLTVVPLTIYFGEEEYTDGVDITHKEFYEKLVESDVLPTTSQVIPHQFSEVFREVAEADDEAVVITIASKLSGTYRSAVLAAQDYSGRIFVVDSESVTLGAGILAEYALKLADSGMSGKNIVEELEKKRKDIILVAMLDTLEYLKKGGRISKTAAIAGGILAIKPVIAVENGEIKILGKARGSKQGNNLLVKEIHAAGGVDFEKPVLLGYTGLSDAVLRKYIDDSEFLWEGNLEEVRCAHVGSVVGTHAGPDAVAVAFFRKENRVGN